MIDFLIKALPWARPDTLMTLLERKWTSGLN